MKRIGLLASVFALCALAGVLAAVVLAADPPPPPTATTGTTTTPTPPTTTGPTTTGTTPTGTTPAPAVIADGVRIAGVVVGGMSTTDAAAAVRTSFDEPLALIAGRLTLAAPPSELATPAIQKAVERARSAVPGTSIPLIVTVHDAKVRAYLGKIADRIDRKPVDSQLFLRKLKPWLSPEQPGSALRRDAAERAISGALTAGRRGPITLGSKTLRPTVTRKNFGPVIVIRRASNRLQLYHGMKPWHTFGVATGQSAYPTPLGRFQIVVKWRNPWWYPPASPWAKGEKPIPPGPDNPLGTRWMGLSSPGVGIHGTPNDGSIGYSLSHGCIRMHIPDAEWLFNHVDVGTPVFITAS